MRMIRINKNKKALITVLAVLFPAVALAQIVVTDVTSLVMVLEIIMNAVVPFLVGLAVLLIIYGIVGYISKADDEEKRTEAKNFIVWGIIGVFVMVSVWGLVNILVNTFFFADNTSNIIGATYTPGVPTNTAPKTLMDLIAQVNAVGSSTVIPFLIGIGFLILLIGIVGYIRHGDNEEKRAEGRMFIIWGVVSIFMMLSIWGFVNILVGTFNLDNKLPTGAIPVIPTLPTTPPPRGGLSQ